MTYENYIASKSWRDKRKQRLEIDGHRCRLCDEDGSRHQLEVHHRPSSYAKIPNESVQDDLITVCSRCHNLITSSIREDRYGIREIEQTIITTNVLARQEIKYHGMANSEIPIDFQRPVDNAQRPTCRPQMQVDKIEQADFIQARKDRRGPRGNGTP